MKAAIVVLTHLPDEPEPEVVQQALASMLDAVREALVEQGTVDPNISVYGALAETADCVAACFEETP